MRKLLIISGALALIGGASAAQADSLGRPCTDKPEGQYLSLDALKAKVVEQGYEIRSGSIKEACGEFYVLDKAGKRAELFLDPDHRRNRRWRRAGRWRGGRQRQGRRD